MSAASSFDDQPRCEIRLMKYLGKIWPGIRCWRVRLVTGSGLLLLCVPLASYAQIPEDDLRLPISLDADSTDYDGKNSMLMFKGLRLTQGNLGVNADEGRATKLDFEDSDWHFSGNVVIDTENGRIECDTADLHFSNHQLRTATIVGTPATFEMQRPESEETTYAEAGRVKYNFELGIVEFSDNATITEGGNQISSNYLVYDIAEQRISAQSAGADGERVKITYTPRSTEADNATIPISLEDLSQSSPDSAEPEANTPDDDTPLPEGAPETIAPDDDAPLPESAPESITPDDDTPQSDSTPGDDAP
jgi:lipopolysaccharide transport protein LptA